MKVISFGWRPSRLVIKTRRRGEVEHIIIESLVNRFLKKYKITTKNENLRVKNDEKETVAGPISGHFLRAKTTTKK